MKGAYDDYRSLGQRHFVEMGSTTEATAPGGRSEGLEERAGTSAPLGATVAADGVNFSVFSSTPRRSTAAVRRRRRDAPSRVVRLGRREHHTYHYWHVFVADLGPARCMPTGRTDPSTRPAASDSTGQGPRSILTDSLSPCRRPTTGCRGRGAGRQHGSMKSVVADPELRLGGDQPLRRPFVETVIYEMHVGGIHPASEFRCHPGQARDLRRR